MPNPNKFSREFTRKYRPHAPSHYGRSPNSLENSLTRHTFPSPPHISQSRSPLPRSPASMPLTATDNLSVWRLLAMLASPCPHSIRARGRTYPSSSQCISSFTLPFFPYFLWQFQKKFVTLRPCMSLRTAKLHANIYPETLEKSLWETGQE